MRVTCYNLEVDFKAVCCSSRLISSLLRIVIPAHPFPSFHSVPGRNKKNIISSFVSHFNQRQDDCTMLPKVLHALKLHLLLLSSLLISQWSPSLACKHQSGDLFYLLLGSQCLEWYLENEAYAWLILVEWMKGASLILGTLVYKFIFVYHNTLNSYVAHGNVFVILASVVIDFCKIFYKYELLKE